MGVGGQKGPMREISSTQQAGRDEAFEKIIERIESSGGEITKDEETPLYDDIGEQEFEVGTERIVEFNLNKFDFKLIRRVETHRLEGAGHQKSIVPLEPPRVKISLKRKTEISNDWQVIDLEDMF